VTGLVVELDPRLRIGGLAKLVVPAPSVRVARVLVKSEGEEPLLPEGNHHLDVVMKVQRINND